MMNDEKNIRVNSSNSWAVVFVSDFGFRIYFFLSVGVRVRPWPLFYRSALYYCFVAFNNQ